MKRNALLLELLKRLRNAGQASGDLVSAIQLSAPLVSSGGACFRS
jgi:hypothetical protein